MAVYNYINDTGVIVPDAATIQQDVINEYLDLFGANLVTSPNTPQGLLIVAEQLARIALAQNNAQLANQINPNLAGGVWLDSIMALTNPFGRKPATQSVVYATISGTPGTIIPAGSIASETASGNNNQFATVNSVTIPPSGSIDNVQFNSVLYGPIPCAASSLTVIVTAVLGWDTLTNSTAAVLGTEIQSDIAARQYRLDTIATQGASQAQAIISEIIRTTDATSVSFLENTAGTTQTINGISMVGHSIYACVNGTGLGTSTIVPAVITGTPGTPIPAGSKASSNGNVFQTLANVTIPPSGTLDPVAFSAVSTGPVPCPIGTLTTIVTPVGGWSTVNNTIAPATLGSESPIAQALVAKKIAGAAYNNGPGTQHSAVVNVPYSGQLMTVLFDTPAQVTINVQVNIKILTSIQNAEQAVQDAIVAYANGQIAGMQGLTVGQNVSSFELAGAITNINPGIYVHSLYISVAPAAPTSSNEITILPYQIALIGAGNIVVNVVN